MYQGPIIDGHHHIWEIKNYPWLVAPMEPKIFGDYEPLRQDYLVEDLIDDFKNQNVVKSVHVQANWGPSSPVEETKWLQEVADRAGFPHGIIAFGDMTKADETERQIEEHKAYANMRGLRHQIFWNEEPKWQAAPSADLAASSAFKEGFKLLKKHDLSFELQMFPFQPVQMDAVCELLDENPDTRVILVHSGMLPLNRPEFHDAWMRGIKRLAQYPNLWCKVSGLALLSQTYTLEQLRFVIEHSIEAFGIERCLFGSNFPLERMWSTYDELLNCTKVAASWLNEGEQKAFFHDNAAQYYRI